MATIDSNGVLIYQDTDNYTPIQTALNLAQSNLSALLGASTQIVKASSISDRNAKATARGSISKTSPFVVWRADAADGLQLEYTTNGTTWRTISDKEYYDVQAALDVRFRKVADEAARTSYVNEVGIANITTANPLAVHRSNAPAGLRFEVTYDGTTWRTIADKEYYDAQAAAQDTGWVDVPVRSGFAGQGGTLPQVRRVGSTVYWRWGFASTGLSPMVGAIVADVPAGFRPAQTTYVVPVVLQPDRPASRLAVNTTGEVNLRPGPTLDNYYVANFSWMVD